MSDSQLRYLGAMTGTSMDGLDLALITIDPGSNAIRVDHGETVPLPESLREALAALSLPPDSLTDQGTGAQSELERLGRADRTLGAFIGDAANGFLQRLGLSAMDIIALGSHGQTVRHRPDQPEPFTLQIGDPNQIAERTGICTVADFRRRDMAAGGQGAPLVPLFHEALFRPQLEAALADGHDGIGILNIGGIANLSVLTADGVVAGFDTGPGNGLLDAWCAAHRGEPYDADGRWASRGQSDGALLANLMADPYFALPAPKSTGREYFCTDWLEARLPAQPPAPEQVQATLLELTAHSIASAVEAQPLELGQLLVCGGGRANGFLMQRLAARSSIPVAAVEQAGVDGDSLEAAAFAWLAHRALQGLPGTVARATGATGPRVLGGIYPGA
ncbi:MAG: anhydro-N-acetylmuramic acid kinase [Pseudomonadota bacterium]